MADVSCLYCGEMVPGVEVTDETDVLAVAHTACHAQAQKPRTCPGCNALLVRPDFTTLRVEGYVCEGCRRTITTTWNLLPISCKEVIWLKSKQHGMHSGRPR